MSAPDFEALIDQYRAGLEAEIGVLLRLEKVARCQRAAADAQELDAVHAASDERERLMAGLVAVEDQLRGIRNVLTDRMAEARHFPGFREAVDLHREAAALVARIVASDSESLEALAAAELSRRNAVKAVEQGDSMLSAYRRVVATPPAARLVDKIG